MCLWKYSIQIELTNKIYLFMPNDVLIFVDACFPGNIVVCQLIGTSRWDDVARLKMMQCACLLKKPESKSRVTYKSFCALSLE